MPFIGLLVGASFALTEVTSFRYEFRKTKRWEEEDVNALKNQGVIKRDPNELTLEKLGVEIIGKDAQYTLFSQGLIYCPGHNSQSKICNSLKVKNFKSLFFVKRK